MTFNNNPFDIPQQSADLDAKPVSAIFDLDSNLIETSMISPASTGRKDSFATSSTAYFSPSSSTNPWGDESYMAPPSTSTTTSHPERHLSISSHFGDNSMGTNDPYNSHHQGYTWPVYDRDDSKTPMSAATFEQFGSEFDVGTASTFHPSVATATGYGGPMPLFSSVRPDAIMPSTGGISPLDPSPPPQPGTEYMALVELDLDDGRLPKRLRHNSPPRSLTPGSATRRGDGVRKKNARFDIPEGRNINNIDQLILQAQSEEEVKDLKQQKRLLRNRQAALDSRQRKKKHTEELEREQKVWLEQRSEVDSKMRSLMEQLDAMRLEKKQWEDERHSLQHELRAMSVDMEEMVGKYTDETSDLRKKIGVLKDQLQHSVLAEPSQPSSDFNAFTNGVDGLHLTDSDWDNYMFNDVLGDDEPPKPIIQEVTGPTSTLVMRNSRKVVDDNQPLAGGLLFMLLLYGAYVASNSNGTGAPVPSLAPEVQAASATLFQDLVKDSQQTNAIQGSRISKAQQFPSMPTWMQPDTPSEANLAAANMRPSSSAQPSLAAGILTPSKAAQAEAAFSITPAAYNSLTSTDFGEREPFQDNDSTTSPPIGHRKGLIDSIRQLKEMRDSAPDASAADVYTRSLLWSRVPEHVLREFRQIVDQRNTKDPGASDQLMS